MNSAKTAPSNLALADVAPAGTAAANSGISRAAAQPGARNVGASLPRRGAAAVLAILLAAFALGGCSSEPPVYTDGAYSGVSSLDDEGAYAEVDITIEEGKISAC
ncbi:MAG: hypothetical protein LBH39_08600, partial [Clostridiales Family XIII bacterium]|nr:hypothetical protein [Clostridiales Family XIII bacterium]